MTGIEYDARTSAPSVRWQTCGTRSLERLAQEGSESGLVCQREFYRWLYDRLTAERRAKLALPEPTIQTKQGPPRRFFPILTDESAFGVAGKVPDNDESRRGSLYFVDVQTTADAPASLTPLDKPALAAYELFKDFFPCARPKPVLVADKPIAGTSFSASVLLATLATLLDAQFPDDAVATGCWDEQADALAPVDPATLKDKIVCAARFGYKTFFVVRGQLGEIRPGVRVPPSEVLDNLKKWGVVESDVEMEFAELPPDPLGAGLTALQYAKRDAETDDAILAAVMRYDRDFAARRYSGERLEDALLPFTDPRFANKIRFATYSLLMAAALHRGETELANQYAKDSPPFDRSFRRSSPKLAAFVDETLDKRLLAWSNLSIDFGRWNDDDKFNVHCVGRGRELAQKIESSDLWSSASDSEIGAAVAFCSQNARRAVYRARLANDVPGFREALSELLRFKEYWDDVDRDAVSRGLKSTTLRRRRNGIVECAFDIWRRTGENPLTIDDQKAMKIDEDATGATVPFSSIEALDDDLHVRGAFDLVCWFRWRAMLDNPMSENELDRFLSRADSFYDFNGYPRYLPFERVVASSVGTEPQRAVAKNRLEKASVLKSDAPNGIDAILALRVAILLGRDFAQYRAPITDRDLLTLFDDLASRPEEIDFRAPY